MIAYTLESWTLSAENEEYRRNEEISQRVQEGCMAATGFSR